MEKIITELEPQKNNPERINVYLDDQFAFGISRFVGAWLKRGDKLEDAKIKELLDEDQREKALQRALRFIAYQPRSEKEVTDKLAAAGIEEAIIDAVMQELREKNYLNDQRFAESWIESRCASKPRSYRFYSYELKRKRHFRRKNRPGFTSSASGGGTGLPAWPQICATLCGTES